MGNILAVSLYYLGLTYMIIAGIIYPAAALFTLMNREEIFSEDLRHNPPDRKRYALMLILVPMVFALGWFFLIPCRWEGAQKSPG